MFQSRLNELLGYELFDLSHGETAAPRRFINTTYVTNDNRFSAYLNGAINSDNLQMQLYSISYNTFHHCITWRLPLNEYEFYTEENGTRKPKLTNGLTEKIYNHLLPEFKEAIEHVMLDYHILIDTHNNNEIIPLSDYPHISYAMTCFETFPLIYFQCKFSRADISQLTKAIRQCVLVSHHSHRTYRVYRFYEFETFNMWSLTVDDLLIPTICIITCAQSIEQANELINRLKTAKQTSINNLIRTLN